MLGFPSYFAHLSNGSNSLIHVPTFEVYFHFRYDSHPNEMVAINEFPTMAC